MARITISGKQGAGKTTVAKLLAKSLNYSYLSIGAIRGEIAQKMNLTIDELNEIGKKENWVHKKADQRTINLGKTKNNFVIEGWIAHHFIPNAFKIFLDVDEKIAIERIFKNQRSDEGYCKTKKEMKKMLNNRLKVTQKQFQKYYNLDFMNKKNYDFIINTSNMTEKEVLDKILKIIFSNKRKISTEDV